MIFYYNKKKLNVNFINNEIYYCFEKEEYMGLMLYDWNGIEKKFVLVEG